MARSYCLQLVTVCVIAAGCQPGRSSAAPPSPPGDELQAAVAAETNVQLASRRSQPEYITAQNVSLRAIPSTVGGVRLWRAQVPFDHWTPYVLGWTSAGLLRLGGFGAPDVVQLSRSLETESLGGEAGVRDLCTRMIRLVDANGGEDVVFPGLSGAPPAVVAAWNRSRPQEWPGDLVRVNSDGRWIVRLTVLSRQVHSYAQGWEPFVYTFLVGPNGVVSAWNRRSANPVFMTA